MNSFYLPYFKTFQVKKWTFEHLFCILVYFLIFSVPFYFSFGSKNFWFDDQYASFEVGFYFTGYYAIQVNYIANSSTQTEELAVTPSSTISKLNKLSVSVNDNSSISSLVFTLNDFNQSITSANVIVYFDVSIPSLQRVVSSSFALSIPGDIQNTIISSRLFLKVSEPFNAITTSSASTVNRAAYFDYSYRTPTKFQQLIDSHLLNNYKLQSQLYMQKVQDTITIPSTRQITLNLLKNTKQTLPYYPSLLQNLKIKFSTYFGMLMLSYLIFNNLLLLLIKDQALQCHERNQIPHDINSHYT